MRQLAWQCCIVWRKPTVGPVNARFADESGMVTFRRVRRVSVSFQLLLAP